MALTRLARFPGATSRRGRDLPPAIKFHACGVTRSGYPTQKSKGCHDQKRRRTAPYKIIFRFTALDSEVWVLKLFERVFNPACRDIVDPTAFQGQVQRVFHSPSWVFWQRWVACRYREASWSVQRIPRPGHVLRQKFCQNQLMRVQARVP